MEGISEQNEMVIRATVGRPVPWNGNLPAAQDDERETAAIIAMLKRRGVPTAPTILARLTGVTRRDANKHLVRLHRHGKARPVGNGNWVLT